MSVITLAQKEAVNSQVLGFFVDNIDRPRHLHQFINYRGSASLYSVPLPTIENEPNVGIRDQGAFRRQPTHLIDIMATIVDLTGASYPSEHNGQKIQPPEGVSLAPAFAGRPLPLVGVRVPRVSPATAIGRLGGGGLCRRGCGFLRA